MPTVKLTSVAVSALPAAIRTRPLTPAAGDAHPGEQRQQGQHEGARVAEPVADGQQDRDHGQRRAGQPLAGDRLTAARADPGPVDGQAAAGLAGDHRHREDRHAEGADGQPLGGDQERAAHPAEALPPPAACRP